MLQRNGKLVQALPSYALPQAQQPEHDMRATQKFMAQLRGFLPGLFRLLVHRKTVV